MTLEYGFEELRVFLRGKTRYFDLFLEVADARAPITSRHPRLAEILPAERRLLVLTRRDLAEPAATEVWQRELGAVAVNARQGDGMGNLNRRLLGRAEGPPRVLVVGFPNLGKSSLLNRLIGVRQAPVGDVPGITRGPHWLRGGRLEALDLPGLKPPRRAQSILALIGVLQEGAFSEEAAWETLLGAAGNDRLGRWLLGRDVEDVLAELSRQRRYLERGGELDLSRARHQIISLFRRGRLGPLTLEWPS